MTMTHGRIAGSQERQPQIEDLQTILQTMPGFLDQWRELVTGSDSAPVESHPDLMVEQTVGEHRRHVAVVYAISESSDLVHLAVLMPKLIRLPLFLGLPWKLPLRGLRLVGSQVIGADNDCSLRAAVAQFESLLAAGHHDGILLEDVEVDSPLWRAVQDSGQARIVSLAAPQTRWSLNLPGEAESYWGQFSSKT